MTVFVRSYQYNLAVGASVKIQTGGRANYFGVLNGGLVKCTFDFESPLQLSSGLGVEFDGTYNQVEILNLSLNANAVEVVVGAGKIRDARLSVPPTGLGVSINGVNPLINPLERLPVVTPKDQALMYIHDGTVGQQKQRLFVPGTTTPLDTDVYAADILIYHTNNTNGSPFRIAFAEGAGTNYIQLEVGERFSINGPMYINNPAFAPWIYCQTGTSAYESFGRFFS